MKPHSPADGPEPLDRYEAVRTRPAFDVEVPRDGYRWWYVDGISDDGRYGVVVIAFIGSVFSPYYYRARQRGPTEPLEHVAINVGLYRPEGKRWCMTERSARSVSRDERHFGVGPSRLEWQDDALIITIRERCAPFAQKLEGRITLHPGALNTTGFLLDAGQRHRWRPVAPLSRLSVDFGAPGCRFDGHAYFDTNSGERPLEADFRCWSWSRRSEAEQSLITYDIRQRDGRARATSLSIDGSGRVEETKLPPAVGLPKGLWRVTRDARIDTPPVSIRDFEDTPFYPRSLLSPDHGEPTMHEFLDLDRFTSRWVRTLLPFRMPRLR